MNKTDKTDKTNDYVIRITSASPAELVVINYEMMLDAIAEAVAAETNEMFDLAANRAKALLDELILSLNPEIDMSLNLISIYLYINKLLMTAIPKKDTEPLIEAERILKELLNSWRVVAENDRKNNPDTVYETTGKIYSGLTYDKHGHPIETEIDAKPRTYEA